MESESSTRCFSLLEKAPSYPSCAQTGGSREGCVNLTARSPVCEHLSPAGVCEGRTQARPCPSCSLWSRLPLTEEEGSGRDRDLV